MPKFKYSPTGDEGADNILNILAMGSDQDERFKFNIGDVIYVTAIAGGSKKGTIAEIRFRRNGYPPPLFVGYWFPIYFLEHLDGSKGGGEIGENCLRLATDEEILSAKAKVALKRIAALQEKGKNDGTEKA